MNKKISTATIVGLTSLAFASCYPVYIEAPPRSNNQPTAPAQPPANPGSSVGMPDGIKRTKPPIFQLPAPNLPAKEVAKPKPTFPGLKPTSPLKPTPPRTPTPKPSNPKLKMIQPNVPKPGSLSPKPN